MNFFNSCHILNILDYYLIDHSQLSEEGIIVTIIQITKLRLRK